MQTNFHLYPPEYDRTTKQPMKDFGFIESLKIDSMVVLIKESYRGFADLSLENYFSTDEQVLDYRLGVVEDLVNNPNLYETFGKAVSMIYNINDMRRAMSSEFTIDSSLRSVRYLELYVEIVTLFADNLLISFWKFFTGCAAIRRHEKFPERNQWNCTEQRVSNAKL